MTDPTQHMREILESLFEAGVNAANHNEVTDNMLQDENGVYSGYKPVIDALAELSKVMDEVRIDELQHVAAYDEEANWLADIKKWKLYGESPSMEVWERIKALQQPNKSEETGELAA